ncbi:MAG: DUF2283 domain-containing protein [Planctomycetota bacterium]|nr:DUF2283 domain-containing protein [Planctomycetota bacterium]
MKIKYDKEVDAAYLRLCSRTPHSAIEIDEGVILHVTEDGKIVSIEILEASKRVPIRNLFTLQTVKV